MPLFLSDFFLAEVMAASIDVFSLKPFETEAVAEWHRENVTRHPGHYSGLCRRAGLGLWVEGP